MKRRDFILGGGALVIATVAVKPTSSLESMNKRRFTIALQDFVCDTIDYHRCEPNDPVTRAMIQATVANYLADIKRNRGIYDYMACCDESINWPSVIDDGDLRVLVLIRFERDLNTYQYKFGLKDTPWIHQL